MSFNTYKHLYYPNTQDFISNNSKIWYFFGNRHFSEIHSAAQNNYLEHVYFNSYEPHEQNDTTLKV